MLNNITMLEKVIARLDLVISLLINIPATDLTFFYVLLHIMK